MVNDALCQSFMLKHVTVFKANYYFIIILLNIKRNWKYLKKIEILYISNVEEDLVVSIAMCFED